MDSDEELDLILLAAIILKTKKRRKKRKNLIEDIYKNRELFGIQRLVNEMQLTNREAL